jgi:hypothetical protein
MRFAFLGLVAMGLALVGPAFSSAAQSGEMKSSYHYEACVCHFGYPSNACVPAVACSSEGGRCAESCLLPPQS